MKKNGINKLVLFYIIITFLVSRVNVLGFYGMLGVALYLSCNSIIINRKILILPIILGMLSVEYNIQIIYVLAFMILYEFISVILYKKNITDIWIKNIFVALLLLSVLSIKNIISGFLLYEFILSIFVSIIVYSVVILFSKGFEIQNKASENINNDVTIACLIISIIAIIASINDLKIVDLSIFKIISVILILIISNVGPGIAAITGISVGLGSGLGETEWIIIGGLLSLYGCVAGLNRKIGKIGTVLGFLLTYLITALLLTNLVLSIIPPVEVLGGCILFFLIPNTLISNIQKNIICENVNRNNIDLAERIRSICELKLKKYSDTIYNLSILTNKIYENHLDNDCNEIAILLERITDKVCKGCSLSEKCWGNCFYTTYSDIFKLIKKIEKKGSISKKDLTENLKNMCIKGDRLIDEINRSYETYKLSLIWKNKLKETRQAIPRQLILFSEFLSSLSKDISFQGTYLHETELLIKDVLLEITSSIMDVIVYKIKPETMCIEILYNKKTELDIEKVEAVLEKVVGMKLNKIELTSRINSQYNKLCYIQKENFGVVTGVARMRKQDTTVSGDSYTFMQNEKKGKHYIALSDGMGSGTKACKQSSTTISIIEQLMEAGFDRVSAIKMINTLLYSQLDEEYTTIEMSKVDLYNGEVEFIKY